MDPRLPEALVDPEPGDQRGGGWEEHLRQRTERQTVSGQTIFGRAHDLQQDGSSPRVRYLFPAD